MSDTPNLDQAAAQFLDAIREGSTPAAVQINELAAKGFFVDGIGSMVCAVLFLLAAVWISGKQAEDEVVIIKWIGIIVCFALGVIIFGCSVTEVFAPESILAMRLTRIN